MTEPDNDEPDWQGVNPLECTVDGTDYRIINDKLYAHVGGRWLPVNSPEQLTKERLIIFGRIADELEVLPWQQ